MIIFDTIKSLSLVSLFFHLLISSTQLQISFHTVLSFTINPTTTRPITNHYDNIPNHQRKNDNVRKYQSSLEQKRLARIFQSIDTNNNQVKNTNNDEAKSQEEKEEDYNKKSDTEISDLDARVLQSLLDDKELDLKSEQSLKKMLQNKEKSDRDGQNTNKKKTSSSGSNNKKDSEFSSTVFKTLSDNGVWNSLRAKADEIIESTKIFVQNRIERDAQLLASLSAFALERALKDVSRALPSAGTSGAAGKAGAKVAESVKRTILALSTNSSFVENRNGQRNNGPLFLPSLSQYDTMINEERTIYDKLSTPGDELKKVTESIKGILSGKSVSLSDRGLRSIAPAGTSRNAERQRMAYIRKKETVLKREKEGIDKKVLRVASTVTDSTWELRRELEVEGNEAGYRSEVAMKRLTASIQGNALLEGGKNWVTKRLKSNQKTKFQLESSISAQEKGKVDDRLKEQNKFFFQDAVVVKEEVVENQIINTTDVEDFIIGEVSAEDINDERRRLISVLTECLEAPEETWLRSDFLQKNQKENPFFLYSNGELTNSTLNNEDAWEKVIFQMVSAKSELESSLKSTTEISRDEILSELLNMQRSIDIITKSVSDCAGVDSAKFLRKQLLGEASLSKEGLDASGSVAKTFPEIKDVDEMYFRDETERSTRASTIETMDESKFFTETISESKYNSLTENEIDDTYEAVIVSDVTFSEEESRNTVTPIPVKKVDSIADADFEMNLSEASLNKTKKNIDKEDAFLASDFEILAADVEVVTIEDDFVKENQVKMGSAAVADEDEETSGNERKDNLILTLTFRTLDVLLFVAEKTVTVGVPGIFNLIRSINKETSIINNRGLGKPGWDRLENINDAKNRY